MVANVSASLAAEVSQLKIVRRASLPHGRSTLIPHHPRWARTIDFILGPIPISIAYVGWWAGIITGSAIVAVVSGVVLFVFLVLYTERTPVEQSKDSREE
jgi:hypothetical protein